MKIKRIVWLVFASLLFCFPVRADMGPKPEIIITVENPPEEEYYLDLLIEGKADDDLYQNIDNNREQYEEALLELLRKNREDGWHLGITDGTGIPMSGQLTGTLTDGTMEHRFGYVGVPDSFKIIVVTKSGAVKITEIYNRRLFVSNLVYDFNNNTIKERHSIIIAYLFQFVTTCIPTLALEGVLLLAFGFSKKRNWFVFLFVNLCTQMLLTATMGTAMVKGGLLAALVVQFFVEILILSGETIVYAFLLQGQGKGRRIGYGITANLCTWVTGYFMIPIQWALMKSLT